MSMALTWAVIFFFFYLLASVLLPELYKSVLQLVSNADNYYRTISGWVEHLLETNPTVEEWVTTQMNTYFEDFTSWLTSGVLPKVQTVMTTVSGGVMSVLNFFKNILVGLIVSVYFLAAKEHCAAYGRKLVSALFSPEKGKWVLRAPRSPTASSPASSAENCWIPSLSVFSALWAVLFSNSPIRPWCPSSWA